MGCFGIKTMDANIGKQLDTTGANMGKRGSHSMIEGLARSGKARRLPVCNNQINVGPDTPDS